MSSQASYNKSDPSQFDNICANLLNSYTNVQIALDNISNIKTELIKNKLPLTALSKLTTGTSYLYRSISELSVPCYEIVRIIKLNSQAWEDKNKMITQMHQKYKIIQGQLNVAIRYLQLQQTQIKKSELNHIHENWAKLYSCLMLKRGLGRRWKFRMQEFKMYKKISENGLLKYLKLIETRQVNSVEQLDSYTSSITKIETFEDESIMSSDGSIVTPSYESEQYVEKIDACVGTKIETAEKALQVFNYKFEKFLHIKLLYPVTEDVLEKVTIKIFNEKEMIDETSISPNNDENDESNKDHDDIDKLKNIYNERENYSKVKLCIDEYIKNNQEICVFEDLKMELYESDQEDVYAHIDIDLDDLNLLGFPVTYTLPHNRDGMEPVVPQYFGLDVNAINENEISMIAPIKFNLLSSISNRPIGKIAIIFYCEYRLIPDYWNHEIGQFDEHDESITEEESIDEQVVEEIEEEETKQVENQELLLYKKKFDEMENLHRQKIEILKNDHRYEYKLMTQEYESTISDLNKKITSMNKQIKKLEKYKKMNPTKGHVLKKSKSPLFISPQLKNSRNINIQNQINDSIYSNNINYKNDELFEDVNPLDEIYVTLKKRNARSIINGFLERLKRNQENSMKLRNKYFQSIKKSIRIATEKSLMNQYKLQPKFIEYGESCIKDVSIPALFMPNPNPNQTLIYNPRLYKFFHSLNTTDRLTQLPAINKMRHSKSDKFSIINLFEISNNFNINGDIEMDQILDKLEDINK